MDRLGYFSNDLVDETLKEAADTFFGKRKALEQKLDLYDEWVQELKQKSALVAQTAAGLNFLFQDEEMRQGFWKEAGLKHSPYPDIAPDTPDNLEPVRAMTGKSRFQKTVFFLYERLHELAHDYNYGQYLDHPQVKGKKVLTPNLQHLRKWAAELNREIDAINTSSRPSEVLGFARRMDVGETCKRESVGSGLEYNYDQQLCYQHVDPDRPELPEYPVPETDKEHKHKLMDFCAQVYRTDKEKIHKLLKSLEN
ncbi:MAG: hypothetical protein ACOCV7_00250 [Desulfonatronovibrionaceae bacterium]